jgi:hypothetical protein
MPDESTAITEFVDLSKVSSRFMLSLFILLHIVVYSGACSPSTCFASALMKPSSCLYGGGWWYEDSDEA